MKRTDKTKPDGKQIQRSTIETAIARPVDPKVTEPLPSVPAESQKRTGISHVKAEADPSTGKCNVTVATDPTKLTGTDSLRVARALIEQSIGSISNCNQRDPAQVVETICQSLEALNPKTIIEGLLCTQMLGVHNLAMEFMRRSLLPEQTLEATTAQTNRAARLLRVFVEQADALQRLRGKAGQQKVTVEHVHVHQGGQAIVGAVAGTGQGPGVGDGTGNR